MSFWTSATFNRFSLLRPKPPPARGPGRFPFSDLSWATSIRPTKKPPAAKATAAKQTVRKRNIIDSPQKVIAKNIAGSSARKFRCLGTSLPRHINAVALANPGPNSPHPLNPGQAPKFLRKNGNTHKLYVTDWNSTDPRSTSRMATNLLKK